VLEPDDIPITVPPNERPVGPMSVAAPFVGLIE
jgi:hypothetical protein